VPLGRELNGVWGGAIRFKRVSGAGPAEDGEGTPSTIISIRMGRPSAHRENE